MDAKVELATRETVSEDSTWNLSGLYSASEAWQKEFTTLENDAKGYAAHRGKLGGSCAALKACLEFDMSISRVLEKLYTFAHLRNDEDKTNTIHQENFERVVRLSTQISQARSFIESEIMSIPESQINDFLQDKASSRTDVALSAAHPVGKGRGSSGIHSRDRPRGERRF